MRKIKYIIMDVDGTLTDGKVYMGNHGELMKIFNIKDGYGIHNILPDIGVTPVVITGRKSQIVANRCKELGIEKLSQGILDKTSELISSIGGEKNLFQVAYIGDDSNDLECMKRVKLSGGLVGCPSDASSDILEISDFVSQYSGGNGAVRDFIDYIKDLNETG